jgi:DEAD/DEAH box helicase domain-containing protein
MAASQHGLAGGQTRGLAARASTTLETVQEALGALVARYRTDEVLTAVRHIPAREAQFRGLPAWVRPELAAAYHAKGIEKLYTHQAAAAERAHAGKNFVVVTPTASGKTLCYNLPVLNAVLENADTRALYLFPTKALAQDQLAELHDLAKRLDDCFGVFTYDGDTPSDARRAIRERGHVILTNPDMLHTGILPHHTKWTRVFENLRYIVLDELHTYRGVFGSHLANVLRRLARIAEFYGSKPQFICCSATIANPGELAAQLIAEPVQVVEENGAPAAEKLFVFYNPPIVNRNLGIRRSYLNETTRVAKELLARKLQTIVFANSRLHTEVLLTYLQQANRPGPGEAEPIRGYRGGYLPGERREIERGLRDGRIRGVVATSALYLAARGAGWTTERNLLCGDGGVFSAAGSVHRAASRLFFRALAGACLRAARQSGDIGEPSEVRGVRAAAWARRTLRRRGFARSLRADDRRRIPASQRRELALGAGSLSGGYSELAFGNV